MKYLLSESELEAKLRKERDKAYDEAYNKAWSFVAEMLENPNKQWSYGEQFRHINTVKRLKLAAQELNKAKS